MPQLDHSSFSSSASDLLNFDGDVDGLSRLLSTDTINPMPSGDLFNWMSDSGQQPLDILTTHDNRIFAHSPKDSDPTHDGDSAQREAGAARLLLAVERLRSEREDALRELNYLQMESAIERQSLKQQLSDVKATIQLLQSQLLAQKQSNRHLLERQANNFKSQEQTLSVLCLVISNQAQSPSQPDSSQHNQTPLSSPGLPMVDSRASDNAQFSRLHSELEDTKQHALDIQYDFEAHLRSCRSSQSPNDRNNVMAHRLEELEERILRRTEQIGVHQHDIRRLECNYQIASQQNSEMQSELEALRTDNECLVEDCSTARSERDNARRMLEDSDSKVDELTAAQAQQTTHLERVQSTFDHSERCRQTAHTDELASVVRVLIGMCGQQRLLRSRSTKASTDHALALSLESQRRNVLRTNLLGSLLKAHRKHTALVLVLLHDRNDLEGQLHSLVDTLVDKERIHDCDERELVRMQDHLEQANHRFNAVNSEMLTHKELLVQRTGDIRILQCRIEMQQSVTEELEYSLRSEDLRSSQLAQSYEDSIRHLKDQLQEATHSAEANSTRLRESGLECEEMSGRLAEFEQIQQLLSSVKQELLDLQHLRSAETITYRQETDQRQSSHAAVESELQQRVAQGTQIIEDYRRQLNEALKSSKNANELIEKTEMKLATANETIEETDASISSLQLERDNLQHELTSLELKLQVAEQSCHETEVLLQQRADVIADAESKLEQVTTAHASACRERDLQRLEFEMQQTHHEQDIARLNAAWVLKQEQFVQGANIDHEARISELEDSLRAKLVEIEENDDRHLEILKEKKRLTTKIDALVRKVHILQVKLKEATGNSGVLPTAENSAPHAQAAPSTTTPAAVPIPPSPRLLATGSKVAKAQSESAVPAQRAARKLSQTPDEQGRYLSPRVRSPKPVPTVITNENTVIGNSRKRPIPAEFDPCTPTQAQPIIASPQPNSLRRALKGIRTGFSPAKGAPPMPQPPPSPVKLNQAASRGITDITNNPTIQDRPSRAAPNGKGQSWLKRVRSVGETRPPTDVFSH